MFQLHSQLAKDTFPVLTLPLSRVLLMNDARFPWIILVPEKPGLVDLHDLKHAEYNTLTREIRAASKAMAQLFSADKMNVATLGNMVPQLHIHVIARYRSDAAWPAPVWGKGEAVPYEKGVAEARITDIRKMLESL
ncbi:HIT domain-containing protein [Sneathiella litorea]|uniref:HIT domain-containing protein n=1 Tax=Sneathiella litorea TaxID=2606216 RepID=A0A6L8WC87_9PROT|nr:HIT domain-containing protein [Sneathiella litorea]MZR32030.1 HIT domain-containing protein [Sneathiella litorea]